MILITLPSLYPDACAAALANIRDATRSPHEVIVVSPFEPPAIGNVVWLPERVPLGCAAAHHRAAFHRRMGDHLVSFADDHEFLDGWDEVALRNFNARCGDHAPFALGLRGAHSGHCGSNFGILYAYFPMMRRADVDQVGWIGRDFRTGFGDSDLSMRVWDAGGRVEWSEVGLLRPTPDDKRKETPSDHRQFAAYTKADLSQFLDRWVPKYGGGWGRRIDEFNVDFRPEDNQHLIVDNSLYQNIPNFMDQIIKMV